MKMATAGFKRRLGLLAATALVATLPLAGSSQATTLTWDGGGTTTNWSDAGNWSPGAPVPATGDTLIFTGGNGTGSINNLTGLSISGMTFRSNAIGSQGERISGNALTVTGGIAAVNVFSSNKIGSRVGNAITLGGAPTLFGQTWTATDNTALTFTGSINLNGYALRLDPDNNASIILGGPITGSGSLTALPSGVGSFVQLGTNNSYTGGTTVAGELRIIDDGSLGDASGGLTFANGATLRVSGSDVVTNRSISLGSGGGTILHIGAGSMTAGGNIDGVGSLDKKGSGTLVLTGVNSYSGGTIIETGTLKGNTTSLQGDISNSSSLVFDQAADGTFGGNISGLQGRVTKENTGTLVLSGANTYGGGTTINGGVVQVSANSNLGDSAGKLTFNGGTLATTSTIALNRATALGASGGTFDVANSTALTQGAVISGAGALTKTNGGKLELTAANSYTGATNVNGGTLALSGNGSLASSFIDVAAGASLESTDKSRSLSGGVHNQGTIKGGAGEFVLDLGGHVSGSGSYTNNVQFSGTFGPGNSPALVSVENAIFANSNTLFMELGGLGRGSEYDAIDGLSIALGGGLQVNLIDLGSGTFVPALGNTFDLLAANSITGMFSTFDFTNAVLASGMHWAWNILDAAGGGQVFQIYVAADAGTGDGVPAPGALALLGLGLLGIGGLRRNRKAA